MTQPPYDKKLLPPSILRLLETQDKLDEAALAFKELWEREASRNEQLLKSLVPPHIAAKIQSSDTTIAEGFADVSILFVDIVSFTVLSSDLTPHGIVGLLDGFFTPIDHLCEKYKLEKIKTIGDAYMLAGGLDPEHDGDHTERVVNCAIEIVELAKAHEPVNEHPFGVRVGVGTGPVVAGVIGRKKITYDLWGDTVNISARMCSEAEKQGIAIDDITYLTIADKFKTSGPETIQVKGKGAMQVYRLLL